MDLLKIGNYIQCRRKAVGLTQKQLAEQLCISFQAVSKWENGESLPDASLLLPLSELLETTTDQLLSGGTMIHRERKWMRVADVIEGFDHLEAIGRCFGKDSLFYTGMVEGISQKMNFDLEDALRDPHTREVLVSEVLIQGIMNGRTVDIDEVDALFSDKRMITMIRNYLARSDAWASALADYEPLRTAADSYLSVHTEVEQALAAVDANGEITVTGNDLSEECETAFLEAQTAPLLSLLCLWKDGTPDVPSIRIRKGLVDRFSENASLILYLQGKNGILPKTLSAML